MNGVVGTDSDDSGLVEFDPTGRYGRYNEVLGKGSSKTVYRGFDEYEGIEVAWNKVKVYDFLQSHEDLERLYCEIHLLKTLKHKNIMEFFTSWLDTSNRNINFVTEMFTSGTLRQYRMKHKKVNIRAIKHWCRQILQGLLYLHSHNPPIIHRDLKCDNIFINGNQGEVKIGDLGLAAILRKSHTARCVGTPEFMAPEVYEEEYNELADIYSFGMCILEMVTLEYPYSECSHPAQIYKRVVSGKKPDALFKVKDPEVRQFVEKCLATVSDRLSAWELLNDPFLQCDDYVCESRPPWNYHHCHGYDEPSPILMHGLSSFHHSSTGSLVNDFDGYEGSEMDLFMNRDDDHLENVDITIKGRRREDNNVFLRLRIADKEGRVRNIYFPFDIRTDTALSVATEMIAELDMTDQDVMKIAEMIDSEIDSLVPDWKRSVVLDENVVQGMTSSCSQNCTSDSSCNNVQVLQCSENGSGMIHGRFEEITYQLENSEQCTTDGSHMDSSRSEGVQFTDIWAQHDGPETEGRTLRSDKDNTCSNAPRSFNAWTIDEDYENEIRQEIRWLKAKYQRQMTELKDKQLGMASSKSIDQCRNGLNRVTSLPVDAMGH